MAQFEPMDVDCLASDFDDKENSVQLSNVLKTPSTEKGYEELDVSELNMKLRYSITPANSPMSRSYTASYKTDSGPNSLNNTIVIDNLTRSLNSTVTKSDVLKSPKLPLQTLPASLFTSSDRRSTDKEDNVTVRITGTDNDENLSIPSTSSSTVQTPEATTPTKEIPKTDGSPIMRGLKSVLNMFRSHSPVPPLEHDSSYENLPDMNTQDKDGQSNPPQGLVTVPTGHNSTPVKDGQPNSLLASTPISSSKMKDSSKRSSPLKDSVVFNDGLERELQWQDESEIYFKHEKIPIHKLLFQTGQFSVDQSNTKLLPESNDDTGNLNSTVEYMDVSNADVSYKSVVDNKTLNNFDSKVNNDMIQSDNEFVDCETTYTQNKSYILETVQECKTSPVVFQTDNITYEACFEDFIEPANVLDNIDIKRLSDDKITSEPVLPDSEPLDLPNLFAGTNDLTSEYHPNNSNNLLGYSEMGITNEPYTSLHDTNTLLKSAEITNMPSEFSIEEHLNYEDNLNIIKRSADHTDNINNANVIDSAIYANTTIKTLDLNEVNGDMQGHTENNNIYSENYVNPTHNIHNSQDMTEYTVNTSTSYIKQSVEDNNTLETIVKNNNLVHDLCTKDDINKTSDIEDPRYENNWPTGSMNIKTEDVIDLDTDDMNTARLLLDIDALILNQVNPNNKNDTSKLTENTNLLKLSDLNVLSTSDQNNKPSKSKTFDDSVGIINNEPNNINMINSIGIDDISNMIEQLNENTLVSNNNVNADNYNTSDTSNEKETEPIELNTNENIRVNMTSMIETNLHKNFENSLSLSDTEVLITKFESDVKIANDFVTSEKICVIDNVKSNNNISYDLKIEICDDNQDITMDSLEPNLHHLTCETITDMQDELKNVSFTNLPLPIDVALPDDDVDENDSSIHPCSIKNTNDVGVISQIETNKPLCLKNYGHSDCKENKDQNIISHPSQILNERESNISQSEVFDIPDHDKMQTKSDVEMAAVQETTCSQLITNQTISLEELNIIDSMNKDEKPISVKSNELCNVNHKFTSSEIVNQMEHNVSNRPTGAGLPDIVQAVNTKSEAYDSNTHETKTEITNKAISLDENIKNDVIDEEIVTSANNSPYVSVTELDLNSSSNMEVKPNDVHIQSYNKTNASPPISPRNTRKGYNINFDEIENPFATKTNVRMSPPPGELNANQKNEIIVQRRPPIRRMSQADTKKSDMNKKPFNKSMDSIKLTNSSNAKKIRNHVINSVHTEARNTEDNKTGQEKNIFGTNIIGSNEIKLQNEIISEADCSDNAIDPKISPQLENVTEFNKCDETIVKPEQNTNNNNLKSKSVFNIPEIDDINFNPFVTKSRVCASPPPTINLKDPITVLNTIEMMTESENITNQNATEVCNEACVQMEVKVSPNKSSITSSSINSDKDITIREVNTEDEDTIEGPFFEAEDLVELGKLPSTDVEKITQFENAPVASSNTDDIEKGELFIDAEAFEFLLNQNKSNVVANSGKESLFLKFDPLFAKRVSSDGVLAALSSIQKRQSTPKKMTRAPLINLAQEEIPMNPTAGRFNVASIPEESNAEIVSTVSKPMMVVNPAVAKQPVATPRISLTPRNNRQSLNFMSPAMVVIDRLLSLSGNSSLSEDDVPTVAASRNHDANIILVQLRELLAEKELHVHSLKSESKELRERLCTLESQVKSLENEGEERLKKVNNLNQRLTEQTKCNKSMALVVEEYERTIATLIAEIEQEKKRNAEERMRLICERDEQTAHLESMEGSFSDLNSKYEKCKQIILSMKANEDAYKKSAKEFDENLLKMQKNYDLLKQHATSKLNHANQELEKMNKAHDADVLKLNAMIKRKELHITSLEESLSQKKKAIEELTAICDELINKVG